ncbi:MAG: hypothetical protein ACOCRX_01475 [Candidatus Woesearchaeota archaeon]
MNKADIIAEAQVKEQNSDNQVQSILPVEIENNNGQIWIRSKDGYKFKVDKYWEVGIEIWEGKLRVVIFKTIGDDVDNIIEIGEVSLEDD